METNKHTNHWQREQTYILILHIAVEKLIPKDIFVLWTFHYAVYDIYPKSYYNTDSAKYNKKNKCWNYY